MDRPEGLIVVADDAGVAAHVGDGLAEPVAAESGDLFRTLGARPIADRDRVRKLPIDTMSVRLDDGQETLAIAHVVIRNPWWRGAWWRGPVTVVMNVEFLGDWDVAPRGHPNDGRVERFDLAADTSVRQRRAIAGRLPSATHLPHPSITRRSARHHVIDCPHGQLVVLDGRSAGVARRVEITVRADDAEVFA